MSAIDDAVPTEAAALPDDTPLDRVPTRDWQRLVALIAIGLVAVGLVLALTRHTPGIGGPDGEVYLSTAEHLRSGDGYTASFDTLFDSITPAVAARGNVPLAHWGPGYPTLIAAGDVVFGTSLRAARFVNAGLFALSVV